MIIILNEMNITRSLLKKKKIGSHSIQFFIYLQQRADDEELRSLHSSAIFTTEMSGTKIESLQRSGLDKISLAKTYNILNII